MDEAHGRTEESSGAPSTEAERVFLAWLERCPRAADSEFIELCDQHPALRAALEELIGFQREALRGLGSEAEVECESSAVEPQPHSGLGAQSLRYEVRGAIAHGGMGEVLEVWDPKLKRMLAMKILRTASREKGLVARLRVLRRRSRLFAEAQILAQLEHPAILPVHDAEEGQGAVPYFTMPRVRGPTFADVIRAVQAHEREWTLPRAVGVLLRVCEAMAYAHERGVVHRDLKPENIMVGRFGEVYVLDWGLAQAHGRSDSADIRLRSIVQDSALPERGTRDERGAALDPASIVRTDRGQVSSGSAGSPLLTMDGDVIGTPAYMPPEQAEGRIEDVDARSDVYALGAVLYHLLSGRRPFATDSGDSTPDETLAAVLSGPPAPLRRSAARASDELAAVCVKAMAREPGARYPSMLALGADLRAWLEGRVVRAHRTGPLVELGKWIRRNKGAAAAVFVLIASVAALAVVQTIAARAEHRLNAGLRRSLYANEIRLAEIAYAAGHGQELHTRLAACPVDRRGWEWRHLSRASDASDAVATAHPGPWGCEQVRWSADGHLLTTAGADSRVIVWDAARLEPLHTFDELDRVVDDLEISPDGSRLYGVDRWNKLCVWDLPRGALRKTVTAEACVSHLALATDGRRFATVGADGRLGIWDAERVEPLVSIEAHAGGAHGVDWSADGRLIVTAGNDGTVRGWDPETLIESWKLPQRDGGIAIAPHGRALAVHRQSPGTVTVIAIPSGEVLARHEPGCAVLGVAWDPRGDRLAVAAGEGAFVWEPKASVLIHLRGHVNRVASIAFSPDGSWLATASNDASLRVWDLSRPDRRESLAIGNGPILDASFDPQSARVACALSDGTISISDVAGRRELASFRHADGQRSVAWSADARWIASGGEGGHLRVRNAASGELVVEWNAAAARIRQIDFDPTSERIASAADDGFVRLWRWREKSLVWEKRLGGMVIDVVISPDGRLVAAAAYDRSIHVADLATGAERWTRKGDGVRTGALDFSPDSRRLLSSGRSGTDWSAGVELRDARTGELFWSVPSDGSAARYSADGTRVFAPEEGGISVRESETGSFLVRLGSGALAISCCEVAPDGRAVLVGTTDGKLRFLEAR